MTVVTKRSVENLVGRLGRQIVSQAPASWFYTPYVRRVFETRGYRIVPKFNRERIYSYRELDQEHLRNCRLMRNREEILDALPKNAVVAEVGIFRGAFSKSIFERASPKKLHLIDCDLSYFDAGYFRQHIQDGVVSLHEGDSSSVLSKFEDEYFDWIYIDGDHSYGGVKRDIQEAVKKIKPDGILVFNDYTPYSWTDFQFYGIPRAVNELCIDDGWELLYLGLERGGYHDVALRRTKRG